VLVTVTTHNFFVQQYRPHRVLHSFPTRRSSDLKKGFCVVAPMSVTTPLSTSGKSTSCCALLNRWSSSTKRIVRRPAVSSSLAARSEEHTSELQSRFDLVCRLLLEKKKTRK